MSNVIVRFPAVLQPYVDGHSQLAIEASTVRQALAEVCASHPLLRSRVFEPGGELRPFVNVFRGESRVRSAEDLATTLQEGEVITLLPAVAGG